MPVGQEAEGADANKAAGQHMQQEAAQELWRLDGHHSLVMAMGIISPAESDLVVGEGDQAMVGDGDAMGVAGEIAEDMMRAPERGFGIDDPELQATAKLRNRRYSSNRNQLACANC
jgi:hypothetical protein